MIMAIMTSKEVSNMIGNSCELLYNLYAISGLARLVPWYYMSKEIGKIDGSNVSKYHPYCKTDDLFYKYWPQ